MMCSGLALNEPHCLDVTTTFSVTRSCPTLAVIQSPQETAEVGKGRDASCMPMNQACVRCEMSCSAQARALMKFICPCEAIQLMT